MAVIQEIEEGETPMSKEEMAKLFEDETKFVTIKPGEEVEAINRFFEDPAGSEEDDSDDDYEEGEEEEDVGPTEEEREAIMDRFKTGVAAEREKYQPSTLEKIFATVKAVLLRALAFYFLMWFFKRNSNPGGSPPSASDPSLDSSYPDDEDVFPMDRDEF